MNIVHAAATELQQLLSHVFRTLERQPRKVAVNWKNKIVGSRGGICPSPPYSWRRHRGYAGAWPFSQLRRFLRRVSEFSVFRRARKDGSRFSDVRWLMCMLWTATRERQAVVMSSQLISTLCYRLLSLMDSCTPTFLHRYTLWWGGGQKTKPLFSNVVKSRSVSTVSGRQITK